MSDTNELSTALYEIAEREEFECTGVVPAAKLTVNPEVRGMCGVDRCKSFAKNWMCPPYCGELDHFQRLIDERKTCFVVQTVKELEDEFDFEGMIDAEHAHKQRFRSFAREVSPAVIRSRRSSPWRLRVCWCRRYALALEFPTTTEREPSPTRAALFTRSSIVSCWRSDEAKIRTDFRLIRIQPT